MLQNLTTRAPASSPASAAYDEHSEESGLFLPLCHLEDNRTEDNTRIHYISF